MGGKVRQLQNKAVSIQKHQTISKKIIITKAQKGWWHGLNGRVPA
jgi:hypothetical protein